MQVVQFGVSMPGLLLIGFLIGIILVVLGYRESEDLMRRNHLMGEGMIVIGVMIPVTPLSWYIYWVGIFGLLTLGMADQAVIVFSLIIGIVVALQGIRVYRRTQ